MACRGCKEVKAVLPEVRLDYTTSSRFRVGVRGETRDIMTCLVDAFGKPAQGWSVSVNVKGQTVQIAGMTASSIIKATVRLLEQNDTSIPLLDVWLNANIQWLSKTSTKHHLVLLPALLESTDIRQ